MDQIRFPLFIKPRRGSAAENTFKIHNPQELEFFQEYVPEPIIQEFIDGPEITNDVVCDLEGQVLAVVSRKRIAVRGGEVVKGVTTFDAAIDSACRKIAEAIPARGPITVQCMIDEDGTPRFIEINARMGGGLPLAVAAGVNIPAMLLQSASNHNVNPVAPGDYEIGLQMTRFDDAFFLSNGK